MKNDHTPRGRVLAFPTRDALRNPSPASAGGATGQTPQMRSTIALLPGAYGVRLTSSRLPGAAKDGSDPGTIDQRRLHVRHKEGITMKTIERIIRTVGRFAVGFGSGIALVCAYVIVTTDIGPGRSTVAEPVEVIRLDPVVVTISSERYDAIRAETAGSPVLVRTPNDGAPDG